MINRIVESVTKDLEDTVDKKKRGSSKESTVATGLRSLASGELYKTAFGTRQRGDQRNTSDRRTGERRNRRRYSAVERVIRRATGTLRSRKKSITVAGDKVRQAVAGATPEQKAQMKKEYDASTKVVKSWSKKKDGRAGRDGDGDGKKNEGTELTYLTIADLIAEALDII